MHLRKKGVKRMGQRFVTSGEFVQNVAEYRYLGCVINEHVKSKVIVDSRARVGARALVLCAWLWRCRVAVGEVQGESFVKLLEAMVESVLLYGAEVWGCCKRTEALVQVQLRSARIFLGVGRRNPRVALLYEVMMLPLVWEVWYGRLYRRRCVGFWMRMMRMKEKRIVRMVAQWLKAWECGKAKVWNGEEYDERRV